MEPELREEIGRLRRAGRTIDEILAALKGMTPHTGVSRSALGRHVQRIERIGERIRQSRAVAEALMERFAGEGDGRVLRANLEAMHSIVMDLVAGDEEGDPVAIDAKQAALLSQTLRNLAQAQKSSADWERSIREAARVEAVEQLGQKDGLDAESLARVREILGVAA